MNSLRISLFLKELINLNFLDLHSNQINDISVLKELKNLQELDLANNQISDILFLQELTNLQKLHLWNNQISDISYLKELTNLNKLDLKNNKIKNFLKELLNLKLEIKLDSYGDGIILDNNPIEEPPLEIMAQGNDAIGEYFKSLEEDQKELNELKVIFIGDGGAGKTSLIKRTLYNSFDKDESITHGINIANTELQIKGINIKAHFWDLGGQEMMHSTHQFFLSNRSLYVLVLDGRKEEDSEYWLNFIRSFGGASPVLIVLNKIDNNEGFELNSKFLQEKYPNIVGFYRTSCLDGRGIKEFYVALQDAMLSVELIKTKWGKSWFNVKIHIEAPEENFINRDRFIDICDKYKVESLARDILANYLDDLSVAIYFNDFYLNEIYTLKPEWVTNGVYKIITSKELGDSRGLIDINSISQLLPSNDYPTYTHRYIVELMKKFELCYQIENTLLIPSRFDVQEPDFNFNSNNALQFEFKYSFLPLSIIDAFIVKSYNDIKDNLRWRNGVVLEDKTTQTEAVIKIYGKEKQISIFVNGEQKRDFFAVIRKRFDDINSRFKEIKIDELIPLPDLPKVKVKYKELRGYEKAGRDEYFNGELGKAFSVSKLLNGIERPESRRSTNIYVEGQTHHFHAGTGDKRIEINKNKLDYEDRKNIITTNSNYNTLNNNLII